MCHWLSPRFGSCLNNDGTGSHLPLLLISWYPLFSHYLLISTSVPASINLSFLWLGAVYTHYLFYLNPLTSVPSSPPSERNSRFPPPRSFSWVPKSQTKPNKPGASSLCTSRLNRTLYHSIEFFCFLWVHSEHKLQANRNLMCSSNHSTRTETVLDMLANS